MKNRCRAKLRKGTDMKANQSQHDSSANQPINTDTTSAQSTSSSSFDRTIMRQLQQPQLKQRQSAAIAMQRHLGNAATARYIQRIQQNTPKAGHGVFILMPSGTIQRENEGADGASASTQAEEPQMLSNDRFSANDTLTQLLRGEIEELSSRQNGDPVQAVQQALFDMGYPLPRYLVDGRFGDETREAIRRFREDQRLPEGTQFDSAAMQALDRAAPAAGQAAGNTLDYGRMLEDNQLTITVALGYDEGQIHVEKTDEFIDFLLGLGFSGSMNDDGVGIFLKMHTFTYEDPQQGQSVQQEVEVRVRMITPSTPDASTQFERGLNADDITVYSGHARYGTGPDFDDKEDPAENFVIGVGSALHESGVLERPPGQNASWYRGHRHMEHVLDQRRNDLERMTQEGSFDPNQYRVWFMNACSTIHYLDELRNPDVAQGLNRDNLDIIGTRSSIYSHVSLDVVESFLQSVLGMETLDQLMAGMQGEVDQFIQDARDDGVRLPDSDNQFFTDGFGNNPTFTVEP